MTADSHAPYKPVRGLSRGLRILHAMNMSASGRSDIAELAADVGLHRTTVRRILETLVTEGYVRRSESDGSYRLIMKVRSLSEGYTDDEWISEIAAPILGQLLSRVVWPSDITTPDGIDMTIRETTHRFSPLSFHRSMVGKKLPMLFTASGRAFLAHCSDLQRSTILHLLSQEPGMPGLAARSPASIEKILERTRQLGYATNQGEWMTEQKVGAIAVPIRRAGEPIGAVNVVYLVKSMATDLAVDAYLPHLKWAAGEIEAHLDAKLAPQPPIAAGPLII